MIMTHPGSSSGETKIQLPLAPTYYKRTTRSRVTHVRMCMTTGSKIEHMGIFDSAPFGANIS
jgi:hypothetical protein